MSFLPVRRTRVTEVQDPLVQLQNDMNQLFERFWRTWNWPLAETGNAWLAPAMDFEEDDKAYYLRLDVPGVDAKDMTIAVDNGMLVISGEKRREDRREGGRAVARERYYGRFQREIGLPGDANIDQLKAELKRGVLTVTIPKAETSPNRRTIPIQGE